MPTINETEKNAAGVFGCTEITFRCIVCFSVEVVHILKHKLVYCGVLAGLKVSIILLQMLTNLLLKKQKQLSPINPS